MKKVFVIGTVHADCGLANASELVVILERIQPEVIFLEAPVGTLEPYLTRRDRTLESEAVSRYAQTHPVALVPVDIPTPPPEFFRNGAELYGKIERRSADYCRLHDRDVQCARERGFPYLNSDTYAEVQSTRHKLILATLDDLADGRLTGIYRLWLDTDHVRETEMMKNIEAHFQSNNDSEGVLLVGAAHRPSLLAKSRERTGAGSSDLIWDFSELVNTPRKS